MKEVNMKLLVLLVSLWLTTDANAQSHDSPEDRASVVEFQIVSDKAQTFRASVVVLKDVRGRDWRSSCRDGVCRNIPWGVYKYELNLNSDEIKANKNGVDFAPGPWKMDVMIASPTVLITYYAEPNGDRSGWSFSGLLSHVPFFAGQWVRAQSLTANDRVDARVNSGGRFELHGLLGRIYSVTVFDKSGKVIFSGVYECCRLGLTEVSSRPKSGGATPVVTFNRGR